MPRCKNCKEKFEAINFNQKYCFSPACVGVWVNLLKTKKWNAKKKKWKEELKTTKDYIKEAQKIFNTYIRLRDKNKPCVSCDKPLGAKYDAGHYYSSGGHKSVTFDERNVHAQCVHCNQYLSGNLLNYQIGLVGRIGGESVLDLSTDAHKVKHWTKEELKSIISEYKGKVKALKDR